MQRKYDGNGNRLFYLKTSFKYLRGKQNRGLYKIDCIKNAEQQNKSTRTKIESEWKFKNQASSFAGAI